MPGTEIETIRIYVLVFLHFPLVRFPLLSLSIVCSRSRTFYRRCILPARAVGLANDACMFYTCMRRTFRDSIVFGRSDCWYVLFLQNAVRNVKSFCSRSLTWRIFDTGMPKSNHSAFTISGFAKLSKGGVGCIWMVYNV